MHRQCRPAGLQKAPALPPARAARCIKLASTVLAARRGNEQASLQQQLGIAAANAVLATSLLLAPQAAVANELKIGADPVVSFRCLLGSGGRHAQNGCVRLTRFPAISQYDGASILSADARDSLSAKLSGLEQ